MFKKTLFVSLALLAGLSQPVLGADRTGIYTGQVVGVVDGRTSITDLAGFQPRGSMSPEGEIQNYALDLKVSINKDLGHSFMGTWAAGDLGYAYVCAVDEESNFHCADDKGYVSGKFTPTALHICRTESGKSGKSVGCGILKKSQ
jgi:hypothetical protein